MVRILWTLVLIIIFTACNSSQQDNSDGDNNNFEFSLDQLGQIEFDISTVDFGSVVLSGERRRSVTITNTGELPLRFPSGRKPLDSNGEEIPDGEEDILQRFNGEQFDDAFSFSGNSAIFPGEGGTCAPEGELASGESCLIVLSFRPTVQQDDAVTLSIFFNNGLDQAIAELPLSAYGGSEAALEFSVSSIDFGNVDQSTSLSRLVTVTNAGGQIAEDFLVNLRQDEDALGRELFSINSVDTTCASSNPSLGIGESCVVRIDAVTNSDQAFEIRRADLEFNFQIDPNSTEVQEETLDVLMNVVSLEAILAVPTATQNFGDFVNGGITERSIAIQNIGFNTAIFETGAQISGTSGAITFESPLNCINLDNEIIAGRVNLQAGQTCILNMTFAPMSGSITPPGDFTSSNIFFNYDNSKTGIQSSDAFAIDATIITPARLEIQGATDPLNETWSITDAFVANDTRFEQQVSFTIENTGQREARSINIAEAVSSPFVSFDTDCGSTLASGGTCQITVTMNPNISLFSGSTSLATEIDFNYLDGTSVDALTPAIANTSINVDGNLDLRSEIVFSDFDSVTTGNVSSVAGSSTLFDVSVSNIGQQAESNFSLVINDPASFTIVDDPLLTVVNGEPNCALIDDGAGVLASGARCSFQIRVFSSALGDVTDSLTIQFNGSDISDPFDLTGTFVSGAQIELDIPAPEDRVAIRTYTSGSYPGPGSSTLATDASLIRGFAPGAIDESLISLPAIPAGLAVDLGLIEAGYYANNASQTISFQLQNNGGFGMEVRNLSIIEQRNETSSSVITGGPFSLPLSSGSCYGASSTSVVSAAGNCLALVDFAPSDGSLYTARVSVEYTTGVRISPTSDVLEVFTSEFTVLAQGFIASSVAQLSVSLPPLVGNAVEMEAVFGGTNTDNQNIIISNTGAGIAGDIHYQFQQSGIDFDIADSANRLSIVGMSPAVAPIDTYFRLAASECSDAVGDQISSSGNCSLDTTFVPDAADEVNFDVVVRYFNGVTYLSESFSINTTGLTPANLIVTNLSGSAPNFTFDFDIREVEEVYGMEVEVFNSGDTEATIVTLPGGSGNFNLIPSTETSPSCGVSIDSGDRCYLTLSYSPIYATIETNELENFLVSYENGILGGGGTENFTVAGNGFSEERHSSHQGWTEIESYGLNADFASSLGGSFNPEDLGFVRIAWNPMVDENGPIINPIESYDILKSNENSFDIHSDVAHANIPVSGGEIEFEFIDDSIDNIPGSVWYYYIVPIRDGRRSRVDLTTFSIASIRIAIPHSYGSMLHKFMRNMEVCRHMNLDVSDVNNINLNNNGCQYINSLGDPETYAADFDVHADMFEATASYLAGSSGFTNAPGDPAVTSNYNNAIADCEDIDVNFPSQTTGVLSGIHSKTLMTKGEHFIMSVADDSTPYVTEDCRSNEDGEVITGEGSACTSKFQLEYGIGGYAEWTTSQLDGLSRGEITNFGGFFNNELVGIDFSFVFTSPIIGQNFIFLATDDNGLSGACFDSVLGMLVPRVSGACNGNRLKDMTLDIALENDETLFFGDESTFSQFSIFRFAQADNTFSINALSGGGDRNGLFLDNYSIYSTDFNVSVNPNGGVRCALRLGY